MAEVTAISSGRTDEQIAKEYRLEVEARLGGLCEIMNLAKREHGLTISFQFTPPDGFGRVHLAMLEISKKLC